ncbi:hypothetical protein HPB48_007829 [Haemaphysalis longicornis]|uniref:DUF4371 domain-containing protein n=1 Tax=Haemaphysalis longicornis TaxID=44386 RepID=A0A9J6GCU2_HAELO|nr:hypothetical protein HPB48_007829 [Haemaphysalis longicornis]
MKQRMYHKPSNSLCAYYVDPTTSSIREYFFCFVPVDDVIASRLADTLKRELLNLGLHLDMMKRQGYDGAAAMSGAFNGVQALIRTTSQRRCTRLLVALPEPFLSDASAVQDIRRAFGTISEVCTFFQLSPKRTAVLKKHLEASTKSLRRLRRYCETRWVERHDSVALFGEALSEIFHSLEEFMDTPPDKPQRPPLIASISESVHSTFFYASLLWGIPRLTHHLCVFCRAQL